MFCKIGTIILYSASMKILNWTYVCLCVKWYFPMVLYEYKYENQENIQKINNRVTCT